MQLAGEQKMMFFYFFPGLTFFFKCFLFPQKILEILVYWKSTPLGGGDGGGVKKRCQRCQKGESQYHCNKVRCAIGRAEQLEKKIYIFVDIFQTVELYYG